MAQQLINVGATANDGTGDDLRTGGQKINANFTELYTTKEDVGTAAAAVAAHEAAGDPHPQYTTLSEATTAANSVMTVHLATVDPHPQYTTDAEATTIAAAAVSTHVALTDPHTQYAKKIVTITDTTTSRILSLTDVDKYIRFTNTGAISVTIPTNTSVAIPIDSDIHIRQANTGQITLVPENGTVTIATAETLKTRKIGSTLTIRKVDVNQWDVFGDLEPV